MSHFISENKRNVLMQIISRIEEELSTFSSKIEDNTNISDDEWTKYEETIDRLYVSLSQLKDEI